MVEKKTYGFYSIAQKTDDFSQSTIKKENFTLMKSYSNDFIIKIRDFLNNDENKFLIL